MSFNWLDFKCTVIGISSIFIITSHQWWWCSVTSLTPKRQSVIFNILFNQLLSVDDIHDPNPAVCPYVCLTNVMCLTKVYVCRFGFLLWKVLICQIPFRSEWMLPSLNEIVLLSLLSLFGDYTMATDVISFLLWKCNVDSCRVSVCVFHNGFYWGVNVLSLLRFFLLDDQRGMRFV